MFPAHLYTSAKCEGLVSSLFKACTCCRNFVIQSDCFFELHKHTWLFTFVMHVSIAQFYAVLEKNYIPEEQASNRLDTRPTRFALLGVAKRDCIDGLRACTMPNIPKRDRHVT